MSIRLVTDKENVDYQAVADILDHFGLSHFDAATEEKIFKNSYATAFIYDGDQVVGCARAISDGVCQAAIYNVALLEEGYRFGDNDYERQPYVSPRSIRQEQEKQNQTVQEREKIMRENTSTEWVNKEVDSEGNFNRQKNQFETPFGEGEGKLPVEPGRYRLLWAPHRSCPAAEPVQLPYLC